MPKLIGVIAVLAVAAVAFIGFQYGLSANDDPSDNIKTSDDNVVSVYEIDQFNGTEDRSIQVKAGEAFSVKLRSNPTTGYGWVAGDHDGSISVKSEYVTDKHEPGMVGVGGTETFTITCSESGDYILELEYKRSWENVDPISKLILHIACSD